MESSQHIKFGEENSADTSQRFAEIFRNNFAPLCGFAQRLVKDAEDARDMVANVFAKVWNKKDYLTEDQNLEAILYKSVRNECLKYLQRNKFHSTEHEKIMREVYDNTTSDNEFITHEILREIFLQIENLPSQCQDIFKLLYYKGLSTEQVATQLGVAVQTVRNQKTRAISLLRKKIFPDELFTLAAIGATALAALSLATLLLFTIGVI